MAAREGSPLTIALLINETYGSFYQYSIISGVYDAAQRNGLNLIIVCGSELNTPRLGFRGANVLYQWVGAENADGMILTVPLFNYVDRVLHQRFCDDLKPMPLRVMGRIESDSPNVVIENAAGLRDLIRHLVEHHGYRRLAFVRGPENNLDAEERFSVYKEVLVEYNLPFDPDLVVQGNFRYASGEEAVRILWDDRRAKVDALIAANDDMALGALAALLARGVKVPEQVAVTGFDNSDGASAVTPALTTVHQPVYQQAYTSVELLLKQIRGETAPETFVLPTAPVYRDSCGCSSSAIQKTMIMGDLSVEQETGTLQNYFSKKRQDILLSVHQPASGLLEVVADQCDLLIQAFVADLQSKDCKQARGAFFLALEKAVRETKVPNDRAMEWHVLLSLMRQQLLPFLVRDPSVLIAADTLWQAGHVLVSERLQQRRAINRVRKEEVDHSFQWITRDLMTTFDQDALMDVLAGALPGLRIPDCYVGVYENPRNIAGSTRLILKYESGGRIELENGGHLFSSPQELVRSLVAAQEPRILVMESLHFREECFGFVVLGLGASLEQVNLHIGLRESISGGLKGARYITERRRIEEKNIWLATLVESSIDAIIGVDMDEIVTSWNQGAERAYGYKASEIVGRSISLLEPSELLDEARVNRERVSRGDYIQSFETMHRRKDGKLIYVSLTISPINSRDGEVVGTALILRDVTHQKALQAQIIRAQRLESLSTLAGGIAHQFNNINASVKGYLDILEQETDLPQPVRRYVQEALKGVQRSVDITERLQGLAVPSHAASEIAHLDELVLSLLPLFEKRFEAEKIALRLDLHAPGDVKAIPSQIDFVITSLLMNALHALVDRPTRVVTVRTGSAPAYGFVEVSDTGCGIPPENLARIFTPFFTTKGEWAPTGSAQTKVKGVGLSLAVCQSTVFEYGGRIEVESEPEKGSTFRVLLPTETSNTP